MFTMSVGCLRREATADETTFRIHQSNTYVKMVLETEQEVHVIDTNQAECSIPTDGAIYPRYTSETIA